MTSRSGREIRPVVALLAVAGLAVPGYAQPAPTPAETATLLRQVMPALQPTLRAVLDRDAANQPTPWSDDASGLSGTVTAAPATRGGGFCRAIRVTVRDGVRQLALEGQRCRGQDGWGPGHVADAVSVAPEASPLIRDLQVALHRLEYYPGAIDGIASDGFTQALLAFERDERVPPAAGAALDASSALLDLADAAIGRIPAAGDCQPPHPIPDRAALACGRIR